MSFLTGSNETKSNVNQDSADVQQQLIKALAQMGLLPGLFPDSSKIDLQPYKDLFTQQNARNFAQAKEGLGNLSGSGVGEVLGARAGEAATSQGAYLADLMEKRRSQDQSIFLQALLGGLGSPAAGVHNEHTPGFLDYAFQGAAAAAPLIGAIK